MRGRYGAHAAQSRALLDMFCKPDRAALTCERARRMFWRWAFFRTCGRADRGGALQDIMTGGWGIA
jgi:hypothetical protein